MADAYMNEAGFQRYCKGNYKTILRRAHVPIKNPKGAQKKLDELLSQKWFWGVLPHNYSNFVERRSYEPGQRLRAVLRLSLEGVLHVKWFLVAVGGGLLAAALTFVALIPVEMYVERVLNYLALALLLGALAGPVLLWLKLRGGR